DFMLGFVSRTLGDDDINVDVLFDDQLFVVTSTQSRWAQRRKIRLAELANEPWILGPPDNAVRALVVEAFRARGLAAPRDKVTSQRISCAVAHHQHLHEAHCRWWARRASGLAR